jgi:O-antigen/teichoic acid export membrane protein
MIIKRNAIANYVGLAYTSLIGVVMLPVYLHYLGAEAYGLIGFFVLLQSWLALLSMGLFPTLARQVAYTRDQDETGRAGFLRLLRSVEIIFILLGLATGIGFWLAGP